MTAFRQTLRTAADLADAGLISRTRAVAIEAVAARYAVAITPAMSHLIDRGIAPTLSPGSSCPMRASSSPAPTSGTTQSAITRTRPSRGWSTAIPIASC